MELIHLLAATGIIASILGGLHSAWAEENTTATVSFVIVIPEKIQVLDNEVQTNFTEPLITVENEDGTTTVFLP